MMASEQQLSPTTDYPRPDFHRQNLNWHSLNGPWDLVFDDDDVGLQDLWQHRRISSHPTQRTINVPYVFQCPASGINERNVHEVLWYEREIPDIRPLGSSTDERLLLRFGAVDYHATVWLEGQYVGEHRGGHVPFDLDITEAVVLASREGNRKLYRLTIRVYDSAFDLTQPRGKQFWGPKSENIFYTPSSGIWQNVWLESVPRLRVADSSHGTILFGDNIDKGMLNARIALQGRGAQEKCAVEVEVRLAGVLVSRSGRLALGREEDFMRFDNVMRLSEQQLQDLPAELTHEIPLKDPTCWHHSVALWSPNHPTLYDLTIRLYDASGAETDTVHTTTGMRLLTWTTGDGTFRLNGRPYFQALFLDQGYWPDTLMTPPSQEALKQDILLSKAMGFNGCRKHQKVEDPVFMYWADRLGFLVWGEMASCFRFSILAAERFEGEWMEMVRRDINHPCIVTWTPVNESWGYGGLGDSARQRDHIRSLYYMTKTLDPTRPVNDNCGWEHVITDLSTFHEYAATPDLAKRCKDVPSILHTGRSMFLPPIYGRAGAHDSGSQHVRGAPVLCTEFGGINVAVQNDHSRKGNWGYSTAQDGRDLLRRFEETMMAVVKEGQVCGVVWTQLCDVEQEANGLYTYGRVPKLPVEGARGVVERCKEVYFEKLRGRG